MAVVFMSSCIGPKDKLYLQKEDVKRYYPAPFNEYKLTVNDEIVYYLMTADHETQMLYNNNSTGVATQNSITFRIYEDGCITLPTLGKVEVAGLTLREAEKLLTSRFKRIAPDAEVKITLANNHFYIHGESGKGQFYMYKENLNIFQALAMSGDITNIGDKQKVQIIRKGIDGIDHIVSFDIRQESIIESEYYYVRPNDVIYIPENSKSFFRIESVGGIVSIVTLAISIITLVDRFK